MEALAATLIILTVTGTAIKESFPKTHIAAAASFILAVFTGIMWPLAIEQSSTRISAWLADRELMKNVAVILSLEVTLQITYCILSVNIMTGEKTGRRKMLALKILEYIPGLLVFPVLFSILVYAIFSNPGKEFTTIAMITACATFAAIFGGAVLIRKAIPERELRTELLFMNSCLIGILGVVTTVNGSTSAESVNSVDAASLAGVLALFMAVSLLGFIHYKYRNRFTKTKK